MNSTTIEPSHSANGSGARTDIAAFAPFSCAANSSIFACFGGELIDIRLFWG
jgi:hypothetical protein